MEMSFEVRGIEMSKLILCKMSVIVFGALLAVQSAQAVGDQKLKCIGDLRFLKISAGEEQLREAQMEATLLLKAGLKEAVWSDNILGRQSTELLDISIDGSVLVAKGPFEKENSKIKQTLKFDQVSGSTEYVWTGKRSSVTLVKEFKGLCQ